MAPPEGRSLLCARQLACNARLQAVLPELPVFVKMNKRLCLFLKYLVRQCWPTLWYGQPSMPPKVCGQLGFVSLFRILPSQKGTR